MSKEITLTSNLQLSSQIVVGSGLLSTNLLPSFIESDRIVYIVDSSVFELHKDYLTRLIDTTGRDHEILSVEGGERSKSLEFGVTLLDKIVKRKPGKLDYVIGIGGGTIMDLTGFLCHLVLRGLRFIVVPTTLLSQVDAAIGGKNGLNVGTEKNKIGAFCYPELVICDISLLSTLSDGEFCNGVAEIIKTLAICDEDTFRNLRDSCRSIGDLRSASFLEAVIWKTIQLKISLLREDPFETSSKRLLNFGHTLGHSIETISGFSIPHGQAVLLGMLFETRIGELTGYCSAVVFEEMYRLVSRFLTTTYDLLRISDDQIRRSIDNVKRSRGGNVNFVVLKRIGKGCIVESVPESMVLKAWRDVVAKTQV